MSTKCKRGHTSRRYRSNGGCHDCHRLLERRRYANNPALRLSRIARQKAHDRRERASFNALKASRGCVDCGNKDVRVLDFDHRPDAKKCFNIGSKIARVSRARLLAEIDKCDIRCANCHRIVTHERGRNK